MDDLLDSSRRGEEEAPGIYECALAELLAEGVATDVRPLLQKFQKAPAAVAEAFALLKTVQLVRLEPETGRRRTRRLRIRRGRGW